MTRTPKDDSRSDEPKRGARDISGGDHAAILRLEQSLDAEVKTSARLRESLDELRAKVDEIEVSFMQRLEDAARRSSTAEHKLADQQKRLAALGNGREETMRLLTEARAELARVSVERDQLRKHLARIDGMQTATVALGEEEIEEPSIHQSLPSIDELMVSLGSIEEAGTQHDSGHLLSPVVGDDEESQEMIAPELVFPEEFGKEAAKKRAAAHARAPRVLVFLDDEQPPVKYPLYKNVMTIGRSEQADIRVDSDFISRVHARLVSTETGVVVEDVDSKNGIRVNSKLTARHSLQHGDVIGIGKLRFTYIDTTSRGDD
jgi:hypothetical protein